MSISILCRADNLLMIKWTKNKWQQFKKWSTVDHWIDLFVDVGLIAFDVLSSPILILVRSVSYTHLRAHETPEHRVWRGVV